MSGEDVVALALAEAFFRVAQSSFHEGDVPERATWEAAGESVRGYWTRTMRAALDEGVIVPGPAGEPTAEELTHDKVLDRAGEYVPPGAGGICGRHGRIYTGSACPACAREAADA